MDRIVIYHLEDDNPLQSIIRAYISYLSTDVELVQFENSNRLIEALPDYLADVDLFLLDIRVPGRLNGKKVAEYLRAAGFDCPIIITSAYEVPHRDWLSQ